jgi:transposase InsO family protein
MMDNILRRRRWIVRRRLEGWKIADIAEALHVNEKTVDRWLSIHRKYGWTGLVVKPHAPHITHRTPQATVDLILKLRRERHWGPCKIEGYLKNHTSEASATVGHTTIHKILNEYGLNNPISRPRKVWGKRRFERLYSNSLWQADFKMTEKDEWMISYLDDHSRFIPSSRIHHNPTAEHAIKLLEESMKQYGKPDQILTDRGTQFYPARGEGPSTFTEFCNGNSIQHIVTSVRRPSTIGKIEAFHKSYKLEAWMFPTHKQFVNYWNYERPHQGISYLYPADVYFRDLTHHSG